MKRIAIIGFACCALALAACSTTTVQTDSAAAAVALTTAERLALVYMSLPQCGAPGATAVCSDPAVKAKIKAADNTAYAAVKSAEAGMTTTAAAVAAITALQALIPTGANP